jgi:hypothetical protein
MHGERAVGGALVLLLSNRGDFFDTNDSAILIFIFIFIIFII